MSRSYADKLRDPRWQKKRLKILERDKWTCQDCKTEDSQLHVHHLVYKLRTNPWDYDDELLCTLCESCHDRRQEVEQAFKEIAPAFSTSNLNTITAALYSMMGFMTEHEIVSFFREHTAKYFPSDE